MGPLAQRRRLRRVSLKFFKSDRIQSFNVRCWTFDVRRSSVSDSIKPAVFPAHRGAHMIHNNPRHKLTGILQKADREEILTRDELAFLLHLNERSQIDSLFQTARGLRDRYFGNKVFLYGFIYISTYCRNNCNFCYYRHGNTQSVRYRRETSEIIGAARQLADSGVHLIDLTLGEDPRYLHDNQPGFDQLPQMVKEVKTATQLPVMISPGVVPDSMLTELAEAGASWYARYQETHNPVLFKRLRPGQSYAARLAKKKLAHKLGLLIEEGLLCGVGESVADIVESIENRRRKLIGEL